MPLVLFFVVFFGLVARGVAAEPTPAPWHVPEAVVRYEVALDYLQSPATERMNKLGPNDPLTHLSGPILDSRSWRAVPDVFLADVPAKQSTLAFDPNFKWLVPGIDGERDGKKQKVYGGEGTWELKPEYRWFVTSNGPKAKVFIDGQERRSETGAFNWWPTQARYRIPQGTKELRFVPDPDGRQRQIGFITRPPAVAEALVCLTGDLKAADLVPVVIADDNSPAGKEVGTRSLSAGDGAAWQVLFDASSGAERFWIYAVPQAAGRRGPEWTPEVGVYLAVRGLDHYDVRVNEVDGFRQVWQEAEPLGVARVEGTMLDWLPFAADGGLRRRGGWSKSPQLMLARWNTQINLPGKGIYTLRMQSRQGATLLVDGVPLVVNNIGSAGKPQEVVEAELTAGRHALEILQWNQHHGFYLSAALSLPGSQQALTFGNVNGWAGAGFDMCDTVAPALVRAAERRPAGPQAAPEPIVTIDWTADRPVHWTWTAYAEAPAEDLVGFHFRGSLSPARQAVAYRFAFDDGRTATGPEVFHVFESPGIRTVTCEAVDEASNRVLGSATARVRVEANRWPLPVHNPTFITRDKEFEEATTLRAGVALFPTLPIADLLNIHAWAGQSPDADLQYEAGKAVAARLDEVLVVVTPDALLAHAGLLADHRDRQHAAAARAYRTVLEREPVGSPRRLTAGVALANLLSTHLEQADQALELLDRTVAEKPTVDWRAGWKWTRDGLHFPNPETAPLPDMLEAKRIDDLVWVDATLPLSQQLLGGNWNEWPAAFKTSFGPGKEPRQADVEIDVEDRERVTIWWSGERAAHGGVIGPRFVMADGSEQLLKADDFQLRDATWGKRPDGPFVVGGKPITNGFAGRGYWFGGNAAVARGAKRFRATVALDDTSPPQAPLGVAVAAHLRDRSYWFRKPFELVADQAGKPLAIATGPFQYSIEGGAVRSGGVWLDGHFLGSPGDGSWIVPAAAVTAGKHELIVLVQDPLVEWYGAGPPLAKPMYVSAPGPWDSMAAASQLALARGGCLLQLGRDEEALAVLRPLAPKDAAWPLNARDRARVGAQIARARRMAAAEGDGPTNAIEELTSLARRWPPLSIDSGWRTTLAEAHAARGEFVAAETLAGRLLADDELPEPERRRALLVGVRCAVGRSDRATAKTRADELQSTWPYAAETVEALAILQKKPAHRDVSPPSR